MTATRSLNSKIALNFSSTVLPMLVGLIAIPALIEGLGLERFGLLSIAWMLVGYFGLLDMGLGRALTQKVAQRLGENNTSHLKPLIWKALGVVATLGVMGSIALAFSAQWLVFDFFRITEAYQGETLKGIYWISMTIPFVIMSTGLFGVLEGQQHFGWTALVRAPLGVLMFLAPLLTMQWTTSLEWVLASLFIIRISAWISLVLITAHTLKPYHGWKSDRNELNSLFKFGGWVTVSNIISPMMVYFDRFYIASVLSAAIVAYYTTPFDLLTKALVVPFALVGVMFAAFSGEWHQNRRKVAQQFKVTLLSVGAVMLPFSLITAIFAEQGLELWLGKEFAEESFRIVQWLAVGVFVNAIAMAPFALIQAAGRADLTAKAHLIELPIYACLLWLCIKHYGLTGAAIAWTLRAGIDAILLGFFSVKLLKQT